MSDMGFVSGIHRFMMKVGGKLLKNGTFAVASVDYTAASQTPVPIEGSEAVDARMGISIASSYAEPHFGGLDLYSIGADHSKYSIGNTFTPAGSFLGTPRITVLDAAVNSEHVGLRTNRRGAILSAGGNASNRKVLYDNIYFDFYAAPAEGTPKMPEYDASKKIQRRRVAMFAREGVRQGMWVMDYENSEKQYRITSVHGTRQLLVLYVEE